MSVHRAFICCDVAGWKTAERLHAGQPREAVIAVALGKHHLARMIADTRFIVLDHLTHLDAEADHLEKRPHRLGIKPLWEQEACRLPQTRRGSGRACF